jgi:hypothetical protein
VSLYPCSRTALAQAVVPPDGLGLAKLQVGGNQEQDVGTPPGQRPPDLWLLQPHALRDGTHRQLVGGHLGSHREDGWGDVLASLRQRHSAGPSARRHYGHGS